MAEREGGSAHRSVKEIDLVMKKRNYRVSVADRCHSVSLTQNVLYAPYISPAKRAAFRGIQHAFFRTRNIFPRLLYRCHAVGNEY